ncbi:uncharacterized protein A1O9_01782 [Exophiala aquamarina CBS 119918]|uniref:DUF3752 domain-containing protein n=1 Tax=Exophiala aquamarina CBS 119918 TaxID=1182545 RepID=A0A072PUS1_9EURO|nr:uncharacterized protein A1O9_01782 [Exophiala aquamarina CBS 119918]KEF63804.1 hypothetical protein A1O9_01782 [Exophiala aquamarina CBS 119918]
MPGVGPQLPPELQKRKHSIDDDGNLSDSSSSASNSPQSAPPPRELGSAPSPKRSRILGPTLPPAPLEERPSSPALGDLSESESSDDDGFGPSLPTAKDAMNKASNGPSLRSSSNQPAPVALKRDEWMTLAPEGGDWSQRVDPTKLKNRKFNTGRGAKGPPQASGAGGDSWHETPEEKLARLQREAMGVGDRPGAGKVAQTKDPRDEAVAKRMKEFNDKARGPALYASHQKSNTEEEDDPSARAFDREKDIGGFKINSTQRRDMVKKAADFSSRFSSAKYL